METQKLLGNTNSVGLIKDPFKKSCVKCVTIKMWKHTNLFSGKAEYDFYSKIDFENGGTSATQEIKGSDMTDAFLKAAEFVRSLND